MPEGSSADFQDVPAMDKGKERAFSPQNFENADNDDERDGETMCAPTPTPDRLSTLH
jgi:hypothetical protein